MPQPKRRVPRLPEKTQAIVQLRGFARELHYSFYALSKIEEILDVNMLGAGVRGFTAQNLSVLVWAGLIDDDESLDTDDPREGIRQVQKWLSRENADQAFRAVLDALGIQLVSATEAPPEDGASEHPLSLDATPTSGSDSGASPGSTSD